jgi:phosphohistidine phosphatase SixA
MRLILVRHGEKEPLSGFPEPSWPLKASAREQATHLREQLEELGFAPAYCLSSRHQHALDTAAILAADDDAKVIPVTGLTPKTDDRFFTLDAVLAEAKEKGITIAEGGAVVLVGHHPRLSQLAKALTRTEPPEPAYLEALVLSEASLAALAEGKAWIDRRCFGAGRNS